jgi:hypothetical protein
VKRLNKYCENETNIVKSNIKKIIRINNSVDNKKLLKTLSIIVLWLFWFNTGTDKSVTFSNIGKNAYVKREAIKPCANFDSR